MSMDPIAEIQFTLGKILSNQESFLENFKQHVADDKDVAKRVSNIESRITWATGVLAAIVFIWGMASHFVTKKLGLL